MSWKNLDTCPSCGAAIQKLWSICPVCGYYFPFKIHKKEKFIAIREKVLSIMDENNMNYIIIERKYLVEFVGNKFIEYDKNGLPKIIKKLAFYLNKVGIEVKHEENVVKFNRIEEDRFSDITEIEDKTQALCDIIQNIMQMVLKIPELMDKSLNSLTDRIEKLEKILYVDVLGGKKEHISNLPTSIKEEIMSELKDLFDKRKKDDS